MNYDEFIKKISEINEGSVKNISFENALKILEIASSFLEKDEASLDDSILIYQKSLIIKTHCQKILDDAIMKITKIETGSE